MLLANKKEEDELFNHFMQLYAKWSFKLTAFLMLISEVFLL